MTLLIWLILAPFTLLTLCFAIELFAGLRPLSQRLIVSAEPVKAVIVVPAHDEEAIIGESLANLIRSAADRATILVVADNCGDSTAEVARRSGVEVVERFDPARRGKGFALDFAKRHFKENPPDVVLVVDADCAIDAQSIGRLVASCAATGRPCQAIYVQSAVRNGPPLLQLSTFAFFIKNVIRQRALLRLAGRVHLLGTGMAFPWALFERANLANANIVEDLEMGLQLAESGHLPLMIEGATVLSEPAKEDETIEQRRRWEGGFLASATQWAPSLLFRSIRAVDARRLWAGIDLLIPPAALLLLLDTIALLFIVIGSSFAGIAVWPGFALVCSVAIAGVGLLAAWASGGSRFITLTGLAKVPLYLLWKLPLYLGLARRGAPKEWVRTGRG